MIFSRERWRSIFSEKQHRGTQKSNKNNKSNKNRENWALPISLQNFTMWYREIGIVWLPRFCGDLGARWGLSAGQMTVLSGNYRPAKIDLENFGYGIFGRKWRFFSIFRKCALKVIYGYFIVSGHFLFLKWPISGHIWHFRPLPDNIWNIKKFGFLGNFCNFGRIGRYM